MREVRTCDFCGDDATGIYEPLPSPVPDDVRLLLCDGCRDRLASVVDPLVERLGDGPESVEGSAGEPPDDAGTPVSADAAAGSEPAGAGPGRDVEPSPTPEPADPPSGVSESRDAGGRPQAERAGTPPGYRKVMRFLENRELPIDRTEAVVLAAEAYDLSKDDVDAVLDHAVEYGRLREVDGRLKQ